MSAWLDPVRRILRSRPGPHRWFFRDDDAGWHDDALLRLIEVFGSAGVHLDLAAIPTAVSSALGRRLADLVDGGWISVHQHGWAHRNHERNGRKCEFGPSRPVRAQEADVLRGRELLRERVSGRTQAIFTPPWNRCTAETAQVLVRSGFAVLSADATAPQWQRPGLAEIPVTVDWTRAHSRGGLPQVATELSSTMRAWAAAPAPPVLGLLLHHAAMGENEFTGIRDLLAELRAQESGALSSIGRLLDESSLTVGSSTRHG